MKKLQTIFNYLSIVYSNNVWFIVNRWHLKKSFKGLVLLLALKLEIINKIQPLIKVFGLNNKLLFGFGIKVF